MKDYLKSMQNKVEKKLMEYLEEIHYPPVMKEGMTYALLNGGKRLRPILHYMTLELLGEDTKKGDAIASAIEMIHSYSLVHDDLPPLDNDDYRRGKLTTHKVYGEANGVLIGDALLTYAFYIVSAKSENIEASKLVEIIRLISKYAGIQGMIGGQVVDIESEGKMVDLPTLQYIHTHKTGMMIRLPIEAATIIAGIEGDKKDKLIRYADLIGLAFQIKDDILDIEGNFEDIGKPVGSDLKLEKSTYPAIFGLEKTKEILREKIDEAKKIINDTFPENNKYFLELADYIENRSK